MVIHTCYRHRIDLGQSFSFDEAMAINTPKGVGLILDDVYFPPNGT